MRYWTILLAAATIVFSARAVHAQDAPPLESCPGYIGINPVALELSWTVSCFLQSIHDKNKKIIATLAPGARCLPPARCDGVLDEGSAHFIFGPSKPYHDKSLFELVTKGKSMVVSFDHSGDQVEVTFAPRPGNPREPLGKGWMSSFFICDFKLDRARGVWIVANGFCGDESDVFTGSDEESGAAIDKAVVDLDGYDSKLPVMVWKPKKKSSSSTK